MRERHRAAGRAHAHGGASAARSAASTPPWWPSASAAAAVLLNPAVDPARDLARYIGEQTACHDPAQHFYFRAEYVDELRALTPAAHHATRALLRRDRQGRRGARLARDERALRRLRTSGCSKAATMRCRTSTSTCPHVLDFLRLRPHAVDRRGTAARAAMRQSPVMYALFDDAGKFLAGRVMSEADASMQVELDSGKRVKVKAANVLLRFEQPAPAELLARGAGAGRRDRPRPGLGVRARRRVRLRRPGARLLRRQRRRRRSRPRRCSACSRRRTTSAASARASSARRRTRSCKAALAAHRAQEAGSRRRSTPGPTSWSAAQCPAPIREQLYRILFKPDKNAPEYKAVVEAARALAARAARPAARRRRDRLARTSSTGGASCSSSFRKGTGFPPLAGAGRSRTNCRWPTVQAFSIDDSATTEIDDALSVQGLGSGTVDVRHPHRRAGPGDRSPTRRSTRWRASACPPSTCRAGRSRCCPTTWCRPTR